MSRALALVIRGGRHICKLAAAQYFENRRRGAIRTTPFCLAESLQVRSLHAGTRHILLDSQTGWFYIARNFRAKSSSEILLGRPSDSTQGSRRVRENVFDGELNGLLFR